MAAKVRVTRQSKRPVTIRVKPIGVKARRAGERTRFGFTTKKLRVGSMSKIIEQLESFSNIRSGTNQFLNM